MRTPSRFAYLVVASSSLLLFALIWYHHDDWREHARHMASKIPHTTLSSPFSESLEPPDHAKSPADAPGDHTTEPMIVPSNETPTIEPPISDPPSSTSPVASSTFQLSLLSATSIIAATSHATEAPSTNPTSSQDISKALVIGKLSNQDTSWVTELSDWDHYVYVVNDTSAPLYTPMNKGREAMAYLTHIVDCYDTIANVTAFVHFHRDGYPAGWHTDNEQHSNVLALQRLRSEFVLTAGYTNLRCNGAVGCPAELDMTRNPKEDDRETENLFPEVWKILMNDDHGRKEAPPPVPDVVAVACCAQFAVSRAQVHSRPLSDYVRYRDWLMETPIRDDISGRIMEYFWHIMFGREAVHCPDMAVCYCDVYGQGC